MPVLHWACDARGGQGGRDRKKQGGTQGGGARKKQGGTQGGGARKKKGGTQGRRRSGTQGAGAALEKVMESSSKNLGAVFREQSGQQLEAGGGSAGHSEK